MIRHSTRVVAAMVGSIETNPQQRVKFGNFFAALERRFPLTIYDASLKGLPRLVNALVAYHPNRKRWMRRFYRNVPAFRACSRQAANYFCSLNGTADVVLQVGGSFDVGEDGHPLPHLIYTDYTAHLLAQKPEVDRSPFSPRELEQWLALERLSFQRSHHVCIRSRTVRASLIADYGVVPERITVVGGGVNFSDLPEVNEQLDVRSPTALFIGKEFYRKGGDLLLRAFAETRRQVPNARLLMLTGDPIPLEFSLEGVEVFRPTWERPTIEALYRKADTFVLPSRLETWGDVLLEAMAYGMPCIGATGQAMQEIIEDGKTGLLVPNNDVEALTAALTRLLANKELSRQWGMAARRKVEAEFTWDRVVDRLAPVIETVAKSSAKRMSI